MPGRSVLALSVALAGSLTVAAFGLSSSSRAGSPPSDATHTNGSRQADRLGGAGDSLAGVFEGRTPCGAIATAFTGFPAQNCEKIKWRLTLYRDVGTGNPTTYLFEGTRATRRGQWRIGRPAAPERRCVVYQLTGEGSATVLSLLAVDEDVLLLLDRDLDVLVGDASWSYALNRVDRPPS